MAKIDENVIINNTNYTLKDLIPVVLYSSSGETGNITFDGNYQDYKYLFVTTENGTTIFNPIEGNKIIVSGTMYSDTLYHFYDQMLISYNSETNKTTIAHDLQGVYYFNTHHQENYKIYKIVGYK